MNNNQKTTGFQNIQNIVQSNRSNRLGSTVKAGVSNVIGQGQQQLGQAQQNFQNQSQQNQVGGQADQTYANQTIQNAGANTSQQDIDRFAKLRAGMYQGPTELGDKDQIINRGQEISGLANAAKDEYGRRGLLQRFVAPQQQYTQGQQRMDNLLLGQTGGRAIRDSRQAANQFNQQLIGADQAAHAQGQRYQQQAQQFGQDLNQQLGQAETDLGTQLQSNVTGKQNQSQAAYDVLRALLTKPESMIPEGGVSTMPVGGLKPHITQEQYDLASPLLSQNPQLANGWVYGLENYAQNPEQIIGSNIPQGTIQNTATEEDKQKALALGKLRGGDSTLFGQDSQVGGYDPLSFLNTQQYQNAVNQGFNKNIAGHNAVNRETQYKPIFDAKNSFSSFGEHNDQIPTQISALQALSQSLGGANSSEGTKYSDLANYLQGVSHGDYQFNRGPNENDNAASYFGIPNLINQIQSEAATGKTDLKNNPEQTLLQRLQAMIA